MSIEFSPEAKAKLEAVLADYPSRRHALLSTLNLAQAEFGHVSPEVEDYVAGLLGVQPAVVREVSSFYTLLYTQPVGRHILLVCRNLSCHILGGQEILSYLEGKLGIKRGETTADGRFTLLESECLGACEMAPMMELDDEYYGPLTKERVDKILGPLMETG